MALKQDSPNNPQKYMLITGPAYHYSVKLKTSAKSLPNSSLDSYQTDSCQTQVWTPDVERLRSPISSMQSDFNDVHSPD